MCNFTTEIYFIWMISILENTSILRYAARTLASGVTRCVLFTPPPPRCNSFIIKYL